MSPRILSITVFLMTALCLCFRPSAGRHAGKNLSCCTRLSTANIRQHVIGNTYREQAATNHCVKAIIFATPKGTVCVNPQDEWVKKLTAKMTKV